MGTKTQELQKYWKSELASYQESGLSQSEFCRRNNHNLGRFKYWLTKLIPCKPKPFVEAKVIESTPETEYIYKQNYDQFHTNQHQTIKYGTLELSNGHKLVIESEEMLMELPNLIHAL